jgi:putative membrane protein
MSDKAALRFIAIVTVVVLLLIVVLKMNIQQSSTEIPTALKFLPLMNAIINGTCSVLLITSFIMIKKKKVNIHKALNLTAFVLSVIFLLSYVTFHFFVPDTVFPKDNPIKPLYLVILITHILFAAIALPFVLFSFYRGLKRQTEKHKKISRWTFPIWLYVTVTGVIVYIMISPYYSF